MDKLIVRGTEINVQWDLKRDDFLSLTDIAKIKDNDNPRYIIQNWLRNRNTIEFLGVWETLYNPNFNRVEFDAFRSQAGLNSFVMTPQKWVDATGAIGIVSKAGRYGGTYAHKEIAFEFASWISVEFKLYLVKEFERLKTEEMKQLGWDILLTAHDLHGGFIGIGIKLFCKLIAAVVVEISGVHIENQLAIFDGIRFQPSGGDDLVLLHLLKHFYIIVSGRLEVNIQRSTFRHDVLIAVAVLFTLIVFLYLCHICRVSQVLISGYGTVYSIVSCHWIFPFFEICRQRRAGERHFFKV